VVIPTVSTVGGRGGAAVSHRTKIALLRTGRVRAAVFCFAVVEGANGTDWMIVLANGSRMTVSLTCAAAGGFIGGGSGLDLHFP